MDIQHLPAFIVASVGLMFIPGADMALVTRQVVVHGRGAAFATLAGLLLGGLMHASFATIGLSAMLLASAAAYTTVKIIGALYLIALGVQMVWSSWHNARDGRSLQRDPAARSRHPMTPRRAFGLGFLSDATNPKVAIFFVTFLPQFVSARVDAALEIAFLGVLFNVIATTWWMGYVLLLDRVSGWLRHSSVRRTIDSLTGTVLIALGIRVAIER
jgi:threonine/homoserine/homoserine lactone efflux protein